ncbi:hypothetical protein [Pseudomonas sp. B26(2017)]|uniref:hypothetical protein n=1 Tax=Pseudomonas sp. B26(2017) TaxID=1981732 RepID=UPI000A1E7CAF|nr:hypothetical protein [Pseudomonas sp. B26(2017)]
MKKIHGPDLKKAVIDLAKCPACRGSGVVKPMFYELDCEGCHASGWVAADGFKPLTLQELVTQLNFKLKAAERQLADARRAVPVGASADYERNNRRGPGGTNYTGD